MLGDLFQAAKKGSERNSIVHFILVTGEKFMEDDCFTLGAAIAFFASLTLFPLLLVIIAFFGFLLASDFPMVVNFKTELLLTVSTFHSALGQVLERSLNTAMKARRLTGLTGVLALFFSGAVFFEQITLALDKIWRVPQHRSYIKRKFISWTVFLVLLVMLFFFSIGQLLLRTAVASLSNYIGQYHWLNWAYFLSYLLFAFLLLTLTYRFLTVAKVLWKHSILGGFIATVSLSLFSWTLGWLISRIDLASFYGPIGIGMLSLVWIYLFSLCILLGGEVSSSASSFKDKR